MNRDSETQKSVDAREEVEVLEDGTRVIKEPTDRHPFGIPGKWSIVRFEPPEEMV